MNIVIGLALAIIGGGLQGAFVLPMKSMKKWEWENGWLVYVVINCLIFPAILAFAFIPNLMSIYKSTSMGTLNAVFWFGAGWGVGSILFGLGAKFLGMAMGIALITGINACLGTLFPILFLKSGQFSAKAGLVLGIGMAVLIVGVIIISIAGAMRDKELKQGADETKKPSTPFIVGLLVCIFAGIFCPMMNFSVFFGQPISQSVKALGTVAPMNVGYAQLLPAMLGGSLAQIIYCIYLLVKNKTFKNFFAPGTGGNWLRGGMMAVYWFVGMVLYTIASANYIKDVGPIVGWPLFLASTIIVSNILGVITKEWKGVSRKAFMKMYLAIACLIVAIALASLSNLFIPR
jgi:L-rhamnose-H+ transport protein